MKTNSLSLVLFALLNYFAATLGVEAVIPAPDGGYPGLNTAEGENALFSLTTGTGNSAVGAFSLFSNTEGSLNTAVGIGTLLFNVESENTAIGTAALILNTTGLNNTAVGSRAMLNNDGGNNNTAIGAGALFNNTTGNFNTAIGVGALVSNTASANTATGALALNANTTGTNNTADGALALQHNTGSGNTATGFGALNSNTTGSQNTAIGNEALQSNTGGFSNTAVGHHALFSNGIFNGVVGQQNTAIGTGALGSNIRGGDNTAIGFAALSSSTGDANIAIGHAAGNLVSTASSVISIGALGANVNFSCYIGNIWNQPGGSQAVYVNSDGKLGQMVSSRRFKDEIKLMTQASEVIYDLKPVSFRYKKEIEPTRPRSFGLIAEDVEKISPDLVTRDGNGQVSSVRYDQVNVMLLNEFLKEHRKNEEQGATIAQQQKEITALRAELKEQASQIQKVSAQLELKKPATQTVKNAD